MGGLLVASEPAFIALRAIGAAYVVVLGVRAR
jgi:threonine/homoserine/homoserine lactone efflux protein